MLIKELKTEQEGSFKVFLHKESYGKIKKRMVKERNMDHGTTNNTLNQ